MSTLFYATVSRRTEVHITDASTLSEGVSKLVETVAALVPAEILVVHAAILSFTTETVEATADAAAVTTITEPLSLRIAFFGLLGFSWLLYVAPRLFSLSKDNGEWESWDYARMFIPPVAFVVWTLLQETSAFNAVCPNWAAGPRALVGAFVALSLLLAANVLAYEKPGGDDNSTKGRTGKGSGVSTQPASGEQAAASAGEAEASH